MKGRKHSLSRRVTGQASELHFSNSAFNSCSTEVLASSPRSTSIFSGSCCDGDRSTSGLQDRISGVSAMLVTGSSTPSSLTDGSSFIVTHSK